MADNVDFTNLDFENIKSSLKSYLQNQQQFKDYNFEGSNLGVLLDILAKNTFDNNFYTNMAISEMFLDSAQLRDSIVSHAKELGYLPRSRRSARGVVNVQFFPVGDPASITIPAQTAFTARCGNATYTFYTDEATSITPSGGQYVANNVNVYEGRYLEEFYTSTGEFSQKFIISNNTVDTNSIKVYVRATASATEETEYVYKDSLFGVDDNDAVFYLQPYSDNRYQILFGRNNVGLQPATNSIVRIVYRTTKAEEANGISAMALASDIDGYDSTTTVVGRTEGGAEREDLESIRFFAPKSIQIQNRAITEEDYKILLKQAFPELRSIAVYGGEKLIPPQYGRVVIAVDAINTEGVSDNTKDVIQDFLVDKSSIAIEPVVVDAKFMYLRVVTNVTYNKNITTKSAGAIRQIVQNAISQYSFNNLEEYKKNFRFSRLSRSIDESDSSIISNDTTVQSIIEVVPTLNIPSYFVLQYENEIERDKTFVDTQLDDYTPAIHSSTFTLGGKEVFVQDDGAGQINLYESVNNKIRLVQKNVGTVDYTTGDVIIKYITVQAFDGNAIKLYARMKNKDVLAPKDRIVSIRSEDTTVTVTSVRE